MPTYTVEKGDTLGKIARRFYGDASKFPLIVAANAINNPDKLARGQQLIITDRATTPPATPTAPRPIPARPPSDRTPRLSQRRLSDATPILGTPGVRLLP